MWSLAVVRRIYRRVHLYPVPLLDPVRNPFRVRAIKHRLARAVARLASLEVHSRVVSLVLVHPYGDGYLLASPSLRVTGLVVAYESAHDVAVVLSGTRVGIVDIVEGEVEVELVQELGDLVVEIGVQRPRVWFAGWHDDDLAGRETSCVFDGSVSRGKRERSTRFQYVGGWSGVL